MELDHGDANELRLPCRYGLRVVTWGLGLRI